jgi:Na+/melibiose symporter and related transporters
MENRLSFKEKLGYGLSNVGGGIWMSFINTFLLYFYTNVAHIRPAIASLIISLAVIWDAINDPLFASLADNHRFKNGEKMRPLLWSSIPLAICLVLCFVVFGKEGSTLSIILAFVTYFLFRIPSTLHMLALNGTRQLVSPVDEHRVSLGTWATGGGALGLALASIIFWPIVRGIAGLDSDGNMIEPRKGFVVAAAIAGLLIVITSVYNYFTTEERVHDDVKEKFRS